MIEQFKEERITDQEFKLLSVASLIKRIRDGITIEELYKDAERKFDTIVGLLNDAYTDNSIISKFGYSLDDLKQVSLLIFDSLISDKNRNPYITLCVLEGSSIEDIKRRRNILLHLFHPDRNYEKEHNNTKTRQINEAYKEIVNIYNKKDIFFKRTQTNIPPSYPYTNSYQNTMKLTILLIIVSSLLALFVVIQKSNFF